MFAKSSSSNFLNRFWFFINGNGNWSRIQKQNKRGNVSFKNIKLRAEKLDSWMGIIQINGEGIINSIINKSTVKIKNYYK